MTSKSIVLAFVLASAPAAWAQVDTAKLSEYSLSIDDLNTIYTSECSADFGPPLNANESAAIWNNSTRWQWDEFNKSGPEELGSSEAFHSFIICYSEPGLSGTERRDKLKELFDVEKNVFEGKEDEIIVGDTVINTDDRACYLCSSRVSSFEKVIETKPESETQFLEIQPANPSMKMIEGTVDAIQRRLDGESEFAKPGDGQVVVVQQDETLGLRLTLCPVVQHFIEKYKISFEDIIEDLRTFMQAANGTTAAAMDFFYTAPDKFEKVSDRMNFWSGVMKNISGLTDVATGTNRCLDLIIGQELRVEESTNSTVAAYFPYDDLPTDQQDIACTWYVVRSMVLHPYVCRMDLQVYVVTKVPDSSSAALVTFTVGLGMTLSSFGMLLLVL